MGKKPIIIFISGYFFIYCREKQIDAKTTIIVDKKNQKPYKEERF